MKISVFITSYNQKHYLIEAIKSVLNQTLQPFEIIIVDDCSTDGSQEVIREYAQAYPDLIRPFYHEQNLGIPRNKSFALEQVQGELVTYLDGDDRFLPKKLEAELETYRNHPGVPIVYSNVYFCRTDEQKLLWYDGDTSPPTGNVFRETFARTFPRGSLFRNELVEYRCLKETGFYDPDLTMYEDWELRIRLTKRFNVAYCPLPLSEYRIHSEGISSSKLPWMHLEEMKKVYTKNQALLADLSELDRLIVEKSLAARFAQLNVMQKDIRIKELNEHLDQLQNSRSWRVTAPLRKIAAVLRGLKRDNSI